MINPLQLHTALQNYNSKIATASPEDLQQYFEQADLRFLYLGTHFHHHTFRVRVAIKFTFIQFAEIVVEQRLIHSPRPLPQDHATSSEFGAELELVSKDIYALEEQRWGFDFETPYCITDQNNWTVFIKPREMPCSAWPITE